jgi:hypothetical protein
MYLTDLSKVISYHFGSNLEVGQRLWAKRFYQIQICGGLTPKVKTPTDFLVERFNFVGLLT